jgi:hypothetical protein
MLEGNDDEVHALAPFLEERLPALGLDVETYGAYILPLLNDTDEEHDEDEWASVMELLQASSESHSDDAQAWLDLRRDIEAAWKTHLGQLKLLEEQEHEHREQQLKEQMERERAIAHEAAAREEERKAASTATTTTTEVPYDAKRALVNRFAYDEDEGAEDTEEAPMTNRDVAKQREVEKANELRSHKRTTKKEEQQKTKEAKQSKVQLKEERKKRATKGERKR